MQYAKGATRYTESEKKTNFEIDCNLRYLSKQIAHSCISNNNNSKKMQNMRFFLWVSRGWRKSCEYSLTWMSFVGRFIRFAKKLLHFYGRCFRLQRGLSILLLSDLTHAMHQLGLTRLVWDNFARMNSEQINSTCL